MMSAGEIADILARSTESVVDHLTRSGRKDGQYINLGDKYGTEGNSLRINIHGNLAGKWTDWATGDHGDLLDLWCSIRGCDLKTAISEAKSFAGIVDSPRVEPARKVAFSRPRTPYPSGATPGAQAAVSSMAAGTAGGT